MEKVRIDKWLWSVRLFKTRSLASKACDNGKVKVDGMKVKPSYQLKKGQEVEFMKLKLTYLYKVIDLIDTRVGAPIAQACYEDKTSAEMIAHNERINAIAKKGMHPRDKGIGRPTKKDRRDLDQLFN